MVEFGGRFAMVCAIELAMDGGAHWEAIGRSSLVALWGPVATVAHIGKRLVA